MCSAISRSVPQFPSLAFCRRKSNPPFHWLLICSLHQRNADDQLRPAPSLLSKLYENQLALEASIMELSNWVEQRGSADVAENIRGALHTIDENEEFIKLTLAVLMMPE